jgi:lupus La protein
LIEDKSTKTENTVAVETEGHEAPAEKGTNSESKKDGVTSDKVREGQKWNNRNRSPKNFKQNVKSDLTSQPVSSDPVEIRKQVEFYFSDSNLMSDNFLYSKVEGHRNLPVPISIIHSFKRMRHFQPYSAVIDALKESEILVVTDDDSCVQRKAPIPEHLKDKPMVEIQKVYEDAAMARSVYVKGFGEEMPSTQFDIEAFFAEHGSTNSVRLRRQNNKIFKGSVFVEFDSEATQKAFLALEPKPKWKGNDLAIKSKKQYCDEKVDDIRAGKVRPHSGDQPSSHRDKRGDNDNRDWRIRRDEDSKSGFKDRNGGRHKGFGSAGRGRGGGRGRGRDRDGRDRNGRDRNDAKKEDGDEK